jgi:cysteinyl-tRNA synthetase
MREIRAYNSLTKKKEKIVPIKKGEISLYTCGPTVYNTVHIGNLRTFLTEDIFVRLFRYLGYKTHHVMNFTDVDDKTIKGSFNAGETLINFTRKYEALFFKDIEALHFIKANHYPRATEFIEKMIEMITILLDKGVAYRSDDGSIYFNITRFKKYGKLSGMAQEDLKEGASNRIKEDEYTKENASDFVLWKSYKKEDHDVYWESPFGKGRPGWHIECSAMSHFYFGNTFDIHCGGIDNLFPHHENEIAQSVASYEGDFAHYFFHVAHLKIDDQKMSKSLKNIYTLNDILKEGYSARTLRYALVSTHYRQELSFSFDLLKQCESALERVADLLKRLKDDTHAHESYGEPLSEKDILETQELVIHAMVDDFNVPKAVGHLFSYVRDVNKRYENLSLSYKKQALSFFKEIDSLFAFLFVFDKQGEQELSKDALTLIAHREEAKKNKDFKKADEIRNTLLAQGIELKDTKEGTIWKKRPKST